MSLEATLEELTKGKITSCSDLSSYCFTGLSFFFRWQTLASERGWRVPSGSMSVVQRSRMLSGAPFRNLIKTVGLTINPVKPQIP